MQTSATTRRGSRLVGKEIKKDNRLDLFGATPPPEELQALMSICASIQHKRKPHRLMSLDVSRLPFQKPRLSGRSLSKSRWRTEHMATRSTWQRSVCVRMGQEMLRQIGSESTPSSCRNFVSIVGRASPCNFKHQTRDLSLTFYGHNFTSSGTIEDLTWLHNALANPKKPYKKTDQDLQPRHAEISSSSTWV